MRSRRKPKLEARDIHEIQRLVVNKSNSHAKILRHLDLEVSKRRIQQILRDKSQLEYTKLVPKLKLTFAEKYQF